MKNVLALGLGIGLIVTLILFFGIGFATPGGLSLTTSNGTFFGPTWHNDTGGAGGAIVPSVTVALGSLPLIAANVAGASSTTITFGMSVTSNNNCGNAGRPAWAPGWSNPSAGGTGAYYAVQFLQNGQPQQFTASIDGAPSQTGTTLFPTNNGSQTSYTTDQFLFGCFYVPPVLTVGGGNIQTTNLATYTNSNPFYTHTITLIGLVGVGTLEIHLPASGPLCAAGGVNSAAQAGTTCYAVENGPTMGGGQYNQGASGTWSTNSFVDIPVIDGGMSAYLVGAGPWFNGGSVTVAVTTGYAGQAGYSLSINNPSPRGGGVASGWGTNPTSVSNNIVNGFFTFSIPSGASTNSSVTGWNEFQIVLKNGITLATKSFPVDISPAYVPGLPGITYTTSSGYEYPLPGDSLTLSFFSNATTANNTPSSILIFVWYLQPGASATGTAACDASWVTQCSGTSIPVTSTGRSGSSSSWTASFTFTVTPTLKSTAIGVQAQALTKNQQSSGISYLTISVLPTGCNPGSPCDSSRTHLSLWAIVGPILLIAAIALAAALVAVLVPLPIWGRITLVAAPVLVLVVLFTSIQKLFLPGGPL